MQTIRHLIAAAGLCLIAASNAALAQTFPSKPVRLILWGAGSFPDIVARRMTDDLSSRWKQPVIVDNRAGAAGILAAEVGVQAPPDGHTLVWGDPVSWVLYQETEGNKGGSNATASLVPVSLIVEVPMVVFVGGSSPAKSLQELLALAKSSSKPLLYASPGIMSVHHLSLALLTERAGVRMEHVPYKTMAQIMTDVAGGDVEVSITGLGTLAGFLKDGRVRALAWTGTQRFDGLKDVPTVIEQGIADYAMTIKAGLFAHKATPTDLIARLSRDVGEAARSPEVVKVISGAGAIPVGSTPEEFTRAAARDIELLQGVAKRLGSAK